MRGFGKWHVGVEVLKKYVYLLVNRKNYKCECLNVLSYVNFVNNCMVG